MTQHMQIHALKATPARRRERRSAYASSARFSDKHSIAMLRDVLQRRIDGQNFHTIATALEVHFSVVAGICDPLHAGRNDHLDHLDERSKIRPCISCADPIVSQHSGVRMCKRCADGSETC